MLLIVVLSTGVLGQERGIPEGPIAYIGHGAMFDREGNEIAPSAEVIGQAQSFYIDQLLQLADEDQRRHYRELEAEIAQGVALDGQAKLVVDLRLLDWLIDEVQPTQAERLIGKNNLMKFELGRRLPERAQPGAPRGLEIFELPPDLRQRVDEQLQIVHRPLTRQVTAAGGQAYRDLCAANGVPIPPDIGTASWVSRGRIPRSQLFIEADLEAEVFTYQSVSPEGVCIALPRFDTSGTVFLDGVICLGRRSSRACFWDNDMNGVKKEFKLGDVVPFEDFGGGSELVAGGVCTDCHAGQNPYIIHPGTSLGLPKLTDVPLFADGWHEPLVKPDWPQNPGPLNSTGTCAACHTSVGPGGAFPQISNQLIGYCGNVLRQATDRTMPPGAPGSLAGDPHPRALLALCNQPPLPIVGVADIVWQHSNGQVHYWPMENGQRQGGIDISIPFGGEWYLRGVGDVDGDDTDDIVWQHSNGQVHYWPMKNGQHQGGIDISIPVSGEWYLRGVGDVDGDDTDDIVWQHSNGQVRYWPMKSGQRQGGIDISIPVSGEWYLRGVGDVDGDDTDDIVWQRSNGQVHYWRMKNGQRQGGRDISIPFGGEWYLRGVGDVDGDDTDDIVWQHSNGQVHYWPMKSGQRQGGIDVFTPVSGDWYLAGVGNID